MPYTTLLRDVFGFDAFRPGQEEIVRAVTEGQNVLAIMPTGGGKSLCFQLPALMRDGVTVVISPLIALMRDQVRALQAAGVGAGALTSVIRPRRQMRFGKGWSKAPSNFCISHRSGWRPDRLWGCCGGLACR